MATCLAIRQPWAHLVVSGAKRFENRSWPTRFTGRLWIAASSRLAVRDWSEVPKRMRPNDPPDLAALPLGAIVGSVEVFGCLLREDLAAELRKDPHAEGPWCWLLRNARPLAVPVAIKSKLRLFDLPPEVAQQLPR